MAETKRHGKIQEPMNPLVSKTILLADLDVELPRIYQVYLDINKAHVLMLAKQGIIPTENAKKILACTQEMAAMGEKPTFEFDPNLEEIYFNMEKYLVDHVGLDAGGMQHTARSRNDLGATAVRMKTRKDYLAFGKEFNKMRRAILALARKNVQTVMSGYTHLQPSEPITFAHYCSAILNGLNRDFVRYKTVWSSVNNNPLGAGSMGSTTFPIDREYTTKLLGFDTVMNNSIDCVASVDFAMEIPAVLAIMASTIGRMCTDFYHWVSPEFGYIEIGDSVASCSSIMPQKKNPITLEWLRTQAALIESQFVGAWSAIKNSPYTLTMDTFTGTPSYLLPVFTQMTLLVQIMAITVETIKTKPERMIEDANGNFCTATELANSIVRKDGMSFRAAHDIVANVVGYMDQHKKKADEIDASVVNAIAVEHFGKPTSLTDEDVRNALDPKRVALLKKVVGGPAPEEVTRQLDLIEKTIDADDAFIDELAAKQKAAKDALEKAVNDFIA